MSEERPPQNIYSGKSTGRNYKKLKPTDYNIPKTTAECEREILQLKEALRLADTNKRKKLSNEGFWYQTLADLSAQERDVLEFYYYNLDESKKRKSDVDILTMKKFSLTVNQLDKIKISAISKLRLYFQDIVDDEYSKIV